MNESKSPITLTQLEAAENVGWDYYQSVREDMLTCAGTPGEGEWKAAVQGSIRKAIESLGLATTCLCKDSDCSHKDGGPCRNCGCTTPYSEPAKHEGKLPLTDECLAGIEARVNAATDGPWEIEDGPGGWAHVYGTVKTDSEDYEEGAQLPIIGREVEDDNEATNYDDLVFIQHAIEDVPTLIVEIRRLRTAVAERDELIMQMRLDVLKRPEQPKSAAYKAVCPGCGERTLYFCTDDDGNASLSCGKDCNIVLIPRAQTEQTLHTKEPIP